MRKITLLLLLCLPAAVAAQRQLTLDSCRALALRNNKQMRVAKTQQEAASSLRRSARTQYLPRVNAIGTYQFTSRAISLLSNDQKEAFPQMGTKVAGTLQQSLSGSLSQLPAQTLQALGQMGLSAETLGQLAQHGTSQLADVLNHLGQELVDALNINSHHLFAGSIMITQPLYMGGSINTMNRMADIKEEMAANSMEVRRQSTLYDIDHAYWQVVSLKHKRKLAESYLEVLKKLHEDVDKMILEGVATKSDGLSVSVKENEAEMALTKVNDGVVLSKMLLCQLCGLPIDEEVSLADEDSERIAPLTLHEQPDASLALANRPELRVLQNMVDLSEQSARLLKAGNLPQVALTGGYAITNPNAYDGIRKRFGGAFHVGVTARIPVWNWGDVKYKVSAANASTMIAKLELDEAREKMELQVSQNRFRLSEAFKKLSMSEKNIEHAEENLRVANIGFQEGVITLTTVMEAQTAWLQSKTQQIDAEIDIRLSQVELQKSLGILK